VINIRNERFAISQHLLHAWKIAPKSGAKEHVNVGHHVLRWTKQAAGT
jgi:hypothetical protein